MIVLVEYLPARYTAEDESSSVISRLAGERTLSCLERNGMDEAISVCKSATSGSGTLAILPLGWIESGLRPHCANYADALESTTEAVDARFGGKASSLSAASRSFRMMG